MRKLTILISLLFITISSWSAYYVAGNGSNGNSWCNGKSWVVNGSPMVEKDGVWTITFTAVPIGSYEFKVTNGSNTWIGFNKFSDSCSNLYATSTGSDANIGFQLQQAQDITITYNGTDICLHGTVGNNYPDPTKYAEVGVPSEYEGVMLQAFYWNSHNLTAFSNTRYSTLATYADEIGETFDLVWFPPSGYGGGVGYYTKCYSNLQSAWGNKAELQSLISTLHNHDCKVLADIVINHFQSSSGWAKNFNTNDFGEYGTFKITSAYICSGDEAFSDSSSDSRSLTHGNADTGTNDAGCRDLDHTAQYVQQMCEAYTKWMLNTIGFDGFRYDMTKGFSGSYLSQYNLASEPFFSVSEFWDDLSAIKNHLEAASYNTLAFDFPLKYKFNAWRGGASYNNLKNPGLRSLGLSKYAVTFIDNHDTFHRSDNQKDEYLGYNTDIASKKAEILAANAYLLMMPGVPCVFWPHWYTYKGHIKRFIEIRKAVGIHSESEVTDETATANSYSATITGHNGKIILRMGTDRDTTTPEGYLRATHGDLYDIYSSIPTAIENVETTDITPRKFIENGVIYIEKNGKTYNVLGTEIK
ncbi:MAG: hypothetical protein IJ834_04490 [Paludibacteraceae bacterium]|nr:hypothetical protein [Paludibacteraceae bacterium]